MAKQPGVLIYFDIAPGLERMDDSEAGTLFKAIFRYAQYGEVSELEGLAAFAFEILRPSLDRGANSYERKCRNGRYAVYIRECKKNGETPLPMDQWEKEIYDTSLSTDNERYLTECKESESSVAESSGKNRNDNESKLKRSVSETGGVGGETKPIASELTDEEFERRRREQIAKLLAGSR